jgi:hypothetical protein
LPQRALDIEDEARGPVRAGEEGLAADAVEQQAEVAIVVEVTIPSQRVVVADEELALRLDGHSQTVQQQPAGQVGARAGMSDHEDRTRARVFHGHVRATATIGSGHTNFGTAEHS